MALRLGADTMDGRAREILFETYWASGSWKPRDQRWTDPADLAYARAAGMMFDTVQVDHATVIEGLIAVRDRLTLRRVADAFVASLSDRELERRSAFGSYVVFRHLAPHEAVTTSRSDACQICGMQKSLAAVDRSLLNFERYKWGGIRHDDPVYAWFDLQQFEKLPEKHPSSEDVHKLEWILEVMDRVPEATTSYDIERRLTKVLPSNKAERDVLVGLFGRCGLLSTPEHRGFLRSFVPAERRPCPAGRRAATEICYPACWWTRGGGIDWTVKYECFGHLL